jgi:hypothetical protein
MITWLWFSKGSKVSLKCIAAELVWLRNLLRDMHYEGSAIMFEDNQSCIHSLAKYEHRTLKHLDVKNHFVQDLAMSKTIDVNYIPSKEQRGYLDKKSYFRKIKSKKNNNIY